MVSLSQSWFTSSKIKQAAYDKGYVSDPLCANVALKALEIVRRNQFHLKAKELDRQISAALIKVGLSSKFLILSIHSASLPLLVFMWLATPRCSKTSSA